MAVDPKVDLILVAVMSKKIEAIAREMTRVIERTARSPLLQIRDFTAGILDAEHRMLSQNEGLPLVAYGFSGMLDHLVDQLGDGIRPGDTFVANDTFGDNNQAQDTAVFRPVFIEDELRFWTATKGHLADLGGRAAGGYDPTATDLWQETIRIPATRVETDGLLIKDVWNLLMSNSRFPELVGGDLKALIGAGKVGERRLFELCDRYGIDHLSAHLEALLDSSEQRMHKEIANMKQGTYHAEATWNMPPGLGRDRLICLLEVTVGPGHIVLDFTGSDPQIDRYYNGVCGTSYAAAMSTFLMLVDPDLPHNAGVERCVEVVFPEGSFLNARFPAPSVMGNFVMNDVIGETIMKAMADAVPDRVTAGWGRGLNVSLYGTDPRTEQDFYAVPLLSNKCGAGASYGVDGWDCIGLLTCGGGFAFDDYEVYESALPFDLLYHEYWEGSAGAGQWRGGLGGRSHIGCALTHSSPRSAMALITPMASLVDTRAPQTA
jgi:N-methylhydantoinase B